MLEEHLSRIRAAEDEARARVAAAEGKAGLLVEEAHEGGRKSLDDARMAAVELERSLLAAARRSADERVSVLRAENAKRLAGLAILAKKSYEKAIDMILKEFRTGA
jgi:vacuolar-type H+-ATPase subunit H